jgi:hypothetical protein
VLLPVCFDAFLQLLCQLQEPCVHSSQASQHIVAAEGLATADGLWEIARLDKLPVQALRQAMQPRSILRSQHSLQSLHWKGGLRSST